MPLDKEVLKNSISDGVRSRREELISLTRDLIRIPTPNPPGENYLLICEYLRDRMRKRNFTTELIRAEGSPGDTDTYPRWNVIGEYKGKTPGQCVHFNSHIDVVEAGEGWSLDPYAGEIRDGKIYGRGTCDMKGGLAASIIAAEVFIDLFPDFAGSIQISGTADEETGGYGGVAHLAKLGYFSPDKVQHVIIPEPLNKDRICLGHRGVWWAEIETKGRIAHGSMPFLGNCAVRHMGEVIRKFESDLFPLLKSRKTEMPVVPEGARQPTLNINSLHGGQQEIPLESGGLPSPCVPDSCRMIIDRRYLLEESSAQVKGEVRDILENIRKERPDFNYDIRDLMEVQPTMTDKDSPVVRGVAESIRAFLGVEPEYVISPGTYDQKHIDRIGRLKNCIAYGPGILDLAHQPDEYVGIDDMLDSACVMVFTLVKLLNVSP